MKNLNEKIDKLYEAIEDENKDEIRAILGDLKDILNERATVYRPLNSDSSGYELGTLKERVEDELYNISVYEYGKKPIKNLDNTRYILSGTLADLIIHDLDQFTGNNEIVKSLKDEFKFEESSIQSIDLHDLIDRRGEFLPKITDDLVITEYHADKLEDTLRSIRSRLENGEDWNQTLDIQTIDLTTGDENWLEFDDEYLKVLANAYAEENDLQYCFEQAIYNIK